MTNTEFLAVLHTVEQDHEIVLHQLKVLKNAIDCLVEPERVEPRAILERLRQSNDYFARTFAAHMAEEERTLFRLLQDHGSLGAEIVAGLKSEHVQISSLREEFGNCLQIALELADQPPRQVLRDLATYGWHLWEALDQHAHRENQAVRQFPGQTFLAALKSSSDE